MATPLTQQPEYLEVTLRIGAHEITREVMLSHLDSMANKREYVTYQAALIFDTLEKGRTKNET